MKSHNSSRQIGRHRHISLSIKVPSPVRVTMEKERSASKLAYFHRFCMEWHNSLFSVVTAFRSNFQFKSIDRLERISLFCPEINYFPSFNATQVIFRQIENIDVDSFHTNDPLRRTKSTNETNRWRAGESSTTFPSMDSLRPVWWARKSPENSQCNVATLSMRINLQE